MSPSQRLFPLTASTTSACLYWLGLDYTSILYNKSIDQSRSSLHFVEGPSAQPVELEHVLVEFEEGAAVGHREQRYVQLFRIVV